MRHCLLTAAFASAALIAPAFGQDAADTPVNTSVDTPPVNISVNASADTPVDTPVNAHADTEARAVDTPIRTADYDGLADTMIGTYYNEPVETFVNTPVPKSDDALIRAPADTPAVPIIASIDAADTVGGKSIDAPSKKIFLLPPYTFHIVFFAASAALIAATLYFFLTRRRNDSRRFLTTTRLSVLDKLVQRGCRHIESNYPDPALTPETVCNSLVTGKAYLDALFMNELGIDVQDFIVQVRVNAIKNLLSAPQERQSADIAEICAECGFADRAEAERCFSAVSGGVGIAEFARFSKMQNQRQGQNI